MAEALVKGTIYIMKGNGKVYIGSTTRELKIRLSHHKSNYLCGSGYGTSKLLFDGDDDVTIEPLEEVCGDLKERERYWIEHLDCVNKCIPGRTQADTELTIVCPCGGKYHRYNKSRHEQTKKHLLYLDKAYREANKDRRNARVDCVCGNSYTHRNRARHIKTKVHQDYLSSLDSLK